MNTQMQVYTPEAAKLMAQERFKGELRTLNETNKEVLYRLIEQGFNPWTDLSIYEKRPYIVIDGWFNAVKRAGRRVGRMPTRPVANNERHLWGLADDELGFVCEIFLDGDEKPFATGFGKASASRPHRVKKDGTGGNPIERLHPARMGMKRSQGHALRQALQAVGTMPQVEIGTYDKEAGILDTEVIEGEVISVDGEPPPPEAPRAAPAKASRRKIPTTPPDFIERRPAPREEAPSEAPESAESTTSRPQANDEEVAEAMAKPMLLRQRESIFELALGRGMSLERLGKLIQEEGWCDEGLEGLTVEKASEFFNYLASNTDVR